MPVAPFQFHRQRIAFHPMLCVLAVVLCCRFSHDCGMLPLPSLDISCPLFPLCQPTHLLNLSPTMSHVTCHQLSLVCAIKHLTWPPDPVCGPRVASTPSVHTRLAAGDCQWLSVTALYCSNPPVLLFLCQSFNVLLLIHFLPVLLCNCVYERCVFELWSHWL